MVKSTKLARETGDRASMSQSFTNLIYHLIFSTKDRTGLISNEREDRLYRYMGGVIRDLGGIALAINGTEDHVHILAKLRPDNSLSDVMRNLKAGSSGWMHDIFPDLQDFSWQRGYGAFTVSSSQVDVVKKYISRQKEHHQKQSPRNEFILFLKVNGIEFDEQYLQ